MKLRLVALLMIGLAIVLIAGVLPVGAAVAAARGRVDALGVWGPVVFGLGYVLATVLLMPASAITLAAGALFGPLIGMIVVSLASTTGATLAFGIARGAGRRRLASLVAAAPRLDALDRAVAAEGWRVVALVRLSPLIPFNLQNYVWGLTGVRFWSYVLTSWIAMLPGTFLFVYAGHVGRSGLEGDGVSVATWTLRGLGLAATVAVTIVLARRARTLLADRHIADEGDRPKRPPRPALTGALLVLAVIMLGAAIWLRLDARVSRTVAGWFGPPRVELVETHERRAGGPDVDHASFDGLLRRYVDADGLVDYRGLASEQPALDGYLAMLADAPLDTMARDQRLALLINAYNAFTLRLILDHDGDGGLSTIRAIDEPWDQPQWRLAGRDVSLNAIEHEMIRGAFAEPRIHFAVVCAAIGCPPLRDEAYAAATLEAQLADQTRRVHASERWYRYDREAGVAHLTPLYRWYGDDFTQVHGGVLEAAARADPRLRADLEAGSTPRVAWLDYDWSLNRQR